MSHNYSRDRLGSRSDSGSEGSYSSEGSGHTAPTTAAVGRVTPGISLATRLVHRLRITMNRIPIAGHRTPRNTRPTATRPGRRSGRCTERPPPPATPDTLRLLLALRATALLPRCSGPPTREVASLARLGATRRVRLLLTLCRIMARPRVIDRTRRVCIPILPTAVVG